MWLLYTPDRRGYAPHQNQGGVVGGGIHHTLQHTSPPYPWGDQLTGTSMGGLVLQGIIPGGIWHICHRSTRISTIVTKE